MRILTPTALTDSVVTALESEPCISGLAVVRGAGLRPKSDLVLADVPRETANDVVTRLRALGVHHQGTIEIQRVDTWLSLDGFTAELEARAAARTQSCGPRSLSGLMRIPNSIGLT